jgi:hypothetical protein
LRLKFQIGIALLASSAASAQNPCVAHRTQPGWQVFVDRAYGFCFEYPSDYKHVTPVFASGPCHVKDGCLLGLAKNAPPSARPNDEDEYKNASIELTDLKIPFSLKALERYGPTGCVDVPPEPVKFGSETFYYYGAGGGGVTYSDQFFFNAKGHAFEVSFEGPYLENGSEPDEVTKQIETKLLGSLHRF